MTVPTPKLLVAPELNRKLHVLLALHAKLAKKADGVFDQI